MIGLLAHAAIRMVRKQLPAVPRMLGLWRIKSRITNLHGRIQPVSLGSCPCQPFDYISEERSVCYRLAFDHIRIDAKAAGSLPSSSVSFQSLEPFDLSGPTLGRKQVTGYNPNRVTAFGRGWILGTQQAHRLGVGLTRCTMTNDTTNAVPSRDNDTDFAVGRIALLRPQWNVVSQPHLQVSKDATCR